MGRPTIILDCGRLPPADARQFEFLARVALAASRRNCDLRLVNASRALLDLIAFAGLADVLRVEPSGQAEQGEQALGIEEEGQLHDPPV